MARSSPFRVPQSWLEGYKKKRSEPRKSKPLTAEVKKRLAVENPHEKALSALIKNPELEKGWQEHYEQVRVFNFYFQYEDIYNLLYSVPNGGARDKATGAKMKAGGLKRGIPDINLDKPKGRYHGLRLELKVAGGKPTAEQIEKMNLLDKEGYFCVLAIGYQEAIDAITCYLNLQPGESMPPQKHDHLWRGKSVSKA